MINGRNSVSPGHKFGKFNHSMTPINWCLFDSLDPAVCKCKWFELLPGGMWVEIIMRVRMHLSTSFSSSLAYFHTPCHHPCLPHLWPSVPTHHAITLVSYDAPHPSPPRGIEQKSPKMTDPTSGRLQGILINLSIISCEIRSRSSLLHNPVHHSLLASNHPMPSCP